MEIKFNHRYSKIPNSVVRDGKSVLLQCFRVDRESLSPAFVQYDTIFEDKMEGGNYRLPDGELIVLLLNWGGHFWTTIRRYAAQKWDYYKSHEGHVFGIVVEEGGR